MAGLGKNLFRKCSDLAPFSASLQSEDLPSKLRNTVDPHWYSGNEVCCSIPVIELEADSLDYSSIIDGKSVLCF